MSYVMTEKQQPSRARTAIYPWLICGLGALFYCYEYLLRIAPSVMTEDLMRSYNITAGALGSMVAFYYHAYTPMQLPVGVMMDRFGPRRLLVMACLFCAFGTYLFACSEQYYIAVVGRFLTGFGSAFAFVGVLKLATIWLPPERFAMISGLATTLGMVGAMVGDNALAALVQASGWRFTMISSAVLGIVLALVILALVRDDEQSISNGQPSEEQTFKSLVFALFQLIKKPQIWINGLIGCLIYLPTSAFAELWGIPYLQNAYNFTSASAAGAISMIFLGWAIGGPLAGLISDRIRRRRLPIVIGAIIAALLITALLFLPGISKAGVYIILFVFGVFSSVQVIVFAIGREISPPQLSGTAIALTNMLVMLCGMIFQPFIGILLDNRWNGLVVNGIHVYSAADYKVALLVLPVGIFVAIILTFFIKETHCKVSDA